MKAIHTPSGKTLELTGTIIKNDRTLITFKGAPKNTFVNFESVTTLDGSPIVPEMFAAQPSATDSDIQSAKNILLSVNDRWNRNSTYKLACDIFGKLNTNGNTFIDSLLNSFFADNKLTEKQAFYLAKFAVETKQF